MSTQYYAPQQSAPPAQRPAKFAPQAGVRQIIAIAEIPGRLVASNFGPSEVVFDLVDGRNWYVPQVVADVIYGQRIASGDQIEVTGTGKKKTDVLIVPLQPRLAAAGASLSTPAAPAPAQGAPNHNNNSNGINHSGPAPAAPAAPAMSEATRCMMSAMCSAVDAAIETQAYAARKGLGLTFSEESVRAIGLSIYISACKGGR